jgi:hypothetical protein
MIEPTHDPPTVLEEGVDRAGAEKHGAGADGAGAAVEP